MKNIEVCLSPELLTQYGIEKKVVVMVDILRASSCMTTAMAHGVKSIIPVATLEECAKLRSKGMIGAAEREGRMADGFDLGNSPFSYMDKKLQGKTIAMTTTNGTLAIKKSKKAEEIIIGSFLNKTAVINYLIQQPHDVLIVCAGWKGKMNLEDTIFGGALIEGLKDHFYSENDSACASLTLYNAAKKDLFKFLTSNSSHYKRLKNLNLDKDIAFCLKSDVYTAIPVLRDNALVTMEQMDFVKA